jgi:hypothetical protein
MKITHNNSIHFSKGKNKQMMKNGISKPESHWVWFEHHGYFPRKDECIHHIDFNKNNNDISNLELMSNSKHAKFHNLLIKINLNLDKIPTLIFKNENFMKNKYLKNKLKKER